MQLALPELAARINQAHAAAELAARSAVEHAITAGELLIEAKARCGHGGWSNWLTANFKGSSRTARAYMRVAAHRSELANRQTSANLSLDQALKLLSAPKPAKDAPLTERLTELRERLAEAETVAECYAIAKEALELQNEAAEDRLRAERSLGQLLNESAPHVQKVMRLVADNSGVDFATAFQERIAEIENQHPELPRIAAPELRQGFAYRAFGPFGSAVEFIPADEPGYWYYHFYDNLDNEAGAVEFTKRPLKLTPELAVNAMDIHDFRPLTDWQVEPYDGLGPVWAKMPGKPGRAVAAATKP